MTLQVFIQAEQECRPTATISHISFGKWFQAEQEFRPTSTIIHISFGKWFLFSIPIIVFIYEVFKECFGPTICSYLMFL